MPTSIWQDGGYTAVNTVTLSYMEMESGMVYGTIPPNASDIAQGMIIEAEGSKVTIKNYDFLSNQYILKRGHLMLQKVFHIQMNVQINQVLLALMLQQR